MQALSFVFDEDDGLGVVDVVRQTGGSARAAHAAMPGEQGKKIQADSDSNHVLGARRSYLLKLWVITADEGGKARKLDRIKIRNEERRKRGTSERGDYHAKT